MTRRAPSLPIIALTALLVLLLGVQHLSRPPIIVAATAPQPPITLVSPTPEPQIDHYWPEGLKPREPDYLLKFPLLHTEIPKRPRKEIVTYTVVGGDTIIGIAKRFGISPESVLWANDRTELNPEFLRIGQELLIPPTTGVLHEVKSGDTIDALAKK